MGMGFPSVTSRTRAANGRPIGLPSGTGGARLASSRVRMGSGVYAVLGLVAARGLGLTPAAVVVGGLLFAAAAISHAEGMGMFPEADGPWSFVRHAFDDLSGFAAGWAGGLALACLTALASLFAVHYLSVLWSPLGTSPWDAIGAIAVIGLLAAANLRGISASSGIEVFIGAIDLMVQLVLIVLGAAFVFHPRAIAEHVHLGSAPSLPHAMLAVGLALVAFTGMDAVTDLAEQAAVSDHQLQRAVRAAVAATLSLVFGLTLVALMAMPVRPLGGGRFATILGAPHAAHGYAAFPMLGIVARLPLHVISNGAGYLFGVAIAGMLVVTAQVGLRGFSRMAQSLAEQSQFPASAARLHPSRQTPAVAIAIAGLVAAGLVVLQAAWGGAGMLAGVYAYGALIALTALEASIIALRLTDPDRYRPVRAGWNLPVGAAADLPLGMLAGAVGCAIAWIAVLGWDPDARIAGTGWMLAGLAGYAVYRRQRGLSLTQTVRRQSLPQAGVGMRVEYRTMLIPVSTDQSAIPADVLEVAARLCSERRASVLLLALTQIPLGEELDMDIDDLEDSVEHLAGQARAIGDQYGIRVHTAHLRTRDPAEAILTEASRRSSDLILLEGSGPQRGPARAVSDKVLRRVAAEAGQRVMIIQPRGVAV